MPIVYYSGPEGACKTVMMGRDCLNHYRLGGKIYAFPGFELKNNVGKVVSQLLMPEQWMDLLIKEESDYIVAIDEIANFINHHKWYNDLNDLITYGAAAQRRKRRMAILATGPIFEWLPPDFRYMFHEVVRLEDRHWKVKSIPRGYQAQFTREDRRGVLSGEIGRQTKPRIFLAKKYWRNVETYSLVDPRYQLKRYKYQRSNIVVDENGQVITPDAKVAPVNIAAIEKFAEQHTRVDARGVISQIVTTLKEKGVESIPTIAMREMVISQGVIITPLSMGKILKELGMYFKPRQGPQGHIYAFT